MAHNMSRTVTEQVATLAAELAGYLQADHAIRSVSPTHRAATAQFVLDRYTPRPADPIDRGFRRRCDEIVANDTTADQ